MKNEAQIKTAITSLRNNTDDTRAGEAPALQTRPGTHDCHTDALGCCRLGRAAGDMEFDRQHERRSLRVHRHDPPEW